jgi:predicted ATP-binding protein involved in virulence
MRLELKLKEIHLENFRLFDDLKVSFDEQLTVFISENGAGKTSLLDGIAKTLFVFTKTLIGGEGLGIINPYKDLTENDVKQGQNGLTISNLITYKLDNILLNQSIVRTKQLGQPNNQPELGNLKPLINKLRDAYSKNQLESLPIIMYYSSKRAELTVGDTSSRNVILNAYDDALTGSGLNFKQFVEWYVWQSQMAIFSKTPNYILQQVKLSILSMLNDDDKNIYTDVYIDPSQFKNPRLVVSKMDNNMEINQLSSGEKNLFVLVSDLARRLCLANPKSEYPLKEGQGIVLIDEIDLHLHPQWQRKVLIKLKSIFPKIQWVVTSHSPLVLSYAPTGKVFKLSNGQVQEYKHFRGMRLMDIFYDLYNITSRPQLIQNQIDALFESVDSENWQKAQTQLNELKLILPEHDPAIVEAQTSLKLAS